MKILLIRSSFISYARQITHLKNVIKEQNSVHMSVCECVGVWGYKNGYMSVGVVIGLGMEVFFCVG